MFILNKKNPTSFSHLCISLLHSKIERGNDIGGYIYISRYYDKYEANETVKVWSPNIPKWKETKKKLNEHLGFEKESKSRVFITCSGDVPCLKVSVNQRHTKADI